MTGWTRITLLAITTVLGACGAPVGSGSGAPPSAAGPAAGSPGPGSAEAGIPADFPLLGSWTVEVTKADLEAAGISDPRARNENSGRFTWTFNPDGTWTTVQESLDGSPVNSPVFRGTYSVDGSTLTSTTTFPDEFRDAGLHYTWALNGDEVRLDLLDPPDPILPLIVETHPWRRAG